MIWSLRGSFNRDFFMMKRSFFNGGLVLLAAFLFSSCGGSSSQSQENAMSSRVLQAVNHERVQRGMSAVQPDAGLRRLAAGHGNYLVRNVHPAKRKPTKEMAHANFQERAAQATKEKYRVLSEVVMVGYAGDLSAVAERTIEGWLNSPSHRRAILHPDRKIMGVATRLPADGRYFVVGLLSNERGGKVRR
jgi:uncharacterized protein YkwD